MQKLGKVFGIISLIMGLIGLALIPIFIWVFVIPFFGLIFWIVVGIAIVFGIIGIAKDDSKGLGIVGLILGIIAIVLRFVIPIILALLGMVFPTIPIF